jgi:UDP-N-acetylglucosamine acyltransferase
VDDWAVIGAFTGVHQFCRVGRHAMIGGYSVLTQDVMPFSTTVSPREAKVFGANKTGLERRGFSPEAIDSVRKAIRLLTHSKLNTTQALERIREEVPRTPEVEELLEFVQSSERGIIK